MNRRRNTSRMEHGTGTRGPAGFEKGSISTADSSDSQIMFAELFCVCVCVCVCVYMCVWVCVCVGVGDSHIVLMCILCSNLPQSQVWYITLFQVWYKHIFIITAILHTHVFL